MERTEVESCFVARYGGNTAGGSPKRRVCDSLVAGLVIAKGSSRDHRKHICARGGRMKRKDRRASTVENGESRRRKRKRRRAEKINQK